MCQNNKFQGIFKDLLLEYLQVRSAIGYDNSSSTLHNLKKMNDFLVEKSPDSLVITKEMFHEYIQLRNGEAVSTQQKRYAAIHGFASFLKQSNYKNIYDSENIVYKRENYIPHIYTEAEISALFKATDAFQHLKVKGIYDHDKMFPVIIRLLYSTGMRISEVLNLKLKDFNKNIGSILIADSKNHISRQIILSDSMKRVLIRYIDEVTYNTLDDYIFHGSDFRKYSYGSVLECFHRILKSLDNLNRMEKLRLHDFRHTFSVRALEKMEDLGYDLYVTLPLLVKYLGHKSVTETEYYLRLTKNNHIKVTQAIADHANDLIPKVEVD